MDIVEITPRQLAPSVGTQRVGSTIPAASSTVKFRYAEMPFGLANSSSTRDSSSTSTHDSPSAEFDAIYFDSEAAARSITFGSFDFTPHSSMSSLVFKSLHGGLDLAFGDLHFYVSNLGVLRLPNKAHPALEDSTPLSADVTISSTSSVGSSDEAKLEPTPFYCSDCDAYHVAAESGDAVEHDDAGFFSNFDRNPRPARFFCAAIDPITGQEETEARRQERETTERANVEALAANARSANVLNITEASWVKARAAILNDTEMPEDATREDLQAYNKLLRAQRNMMAELQDSLDERKRKADESSLRRMLLSTGGSASRSVTGQGSAVKGGPRRRAGRVFDVQGVARNLGEAMDEEADLVPKTADAARMALAAYLSLNQPPEGDPRTAIHKADLVTVDVLSKEA